MRKSSFVLISDVIFSALISFVLFTVMFNYFTDYPYSVVLSSTCALLFALLIYAFLHEKNKKKSASERENNTYLNTMLQLNFMKSSELLNYVYKLYQVKGITAEKRKDCLFIKSENKKIFVRFEFADIKKSDIIKYYNSLYKLQTGTVISENFSDDIKDFALRLNGKLSLLDGKELFTLIKETNCFPESKVALSLPEKKKIDFKILLNKKHALKYFLLGVIFLFYSYLVKYKIYYLVVGTLFLISALFIRLFGKTAEKS